MNRSNPESFSFFVNSKFYIWRQFYISLAIVASLMFLFLEGNWGDIGYWENWVQQLADKGYKDFDGNYPPLYIHWLYVVGQIYNYLGLPVENNFFLKYLSLIPVFISHLLLLMIVHQLSKIYFVSVRHYHLCMLFTALNPAILMNGPVWGQIDVLPVIPVLLAVLASTSERYKLITFPLYTLALLTKFQMIAFAPVMGIIFFRHYKIHLVGCLSSLVVIVLLFLPTILAGSFANFFTSAYIDVFHQYSATTMGAANIWILLTGNAAPDNLILFGIDQDSFFAGIFKAKYVGILSFFLVCLMVFTKGIRRLMAISLPINNPENASLLLFYSMICTAAFFVLLPAMHERYLLPAVITSLLVFVLKPERIIYPLMFSFISAFNLVMCLGLKTSYVWPVISWIMVAIFVYALLELVWGDSWKKFISRLFFLFFGIQYIAIFIVILSLFYTGGRLYEQTKVIQPELSTDRVLLTDFPLVYSKQDFGKLSIHKNLNGDLLQSGSRRYAFGLGTHANSIVEYDLQQKASRLSVSVGLDDSVESASVRFLIWGDGKLLWQSRNHYGSESPESVEVNLDGVRRLRLEVNSLQGIDGDHANWLNPVVTGSFVKN